jgi:hypothetical protein
MNLQQLNDCLADIGVLRRTRTKRTVEHEVDGETQGDEGVAYEICPLPFDGLFAKIRVTTDSYGSRESVSGIEFVRPVSEEVTIHEPSKSEDSTLLELLDNLKNYDGDVYELIDSLDSNDLTEKFGEVVIVDEAGNSEGGGEYSHYIFHFKDKGVYIRVTGCYTSHHGTDWNNDWTIVNPKQETVTVYR